VRRRERFRDHHAFGDDEVDRLVRLGGACAGVVCTLKDAVKLAPRWPATAVPLWYVSQTVQVVSGGEELDGDIARLLAARPGTVPTAG
jgi:tetraacyldisaccharide 4'-kinase